MIVVKEYVDCVEQQACVLQIHTLNKDVHKYTWNSHREDRIDKNY